MNTTFYISLLQKDGRVLKTHLVTSVEINFLYKRENPSKLEKLKILCLHAARNCDKLLLVWRPELMGKHFWPSEIIATRFVWELIIP